MLTALDGCKLIWVVEMLPKIPKEGTETPFYLALPQGTTTPHDMFVLEKSL